MPPENKQQDYNKDSCPYHLIFFLMISKVKLQILLPGDESPRSLIIFPTWWEGRIERLNIFSLLG